MSNFDSDGPQDNEWEDRGELAWNEFDWERYLREQDEAVHRYLGFYEACKNNADRIDDVAELMNWGKTGATEDSSAAADDSDDDDVETGEFAEGQDVYTLHKNPIFISTKALYLGLRRHWELCASDNTKVPQSLALSLLSSLHHGEEQAIQAIHALDFGDYAMAISLFKRALNALNSTLALLNSDTTSSHRTAAAYREMALPRIFDLREIWLRVVHECREELERPIDGEA